MIPIFFCRWPPNIWNCSPLVQGWVIGARKKSTFQTRGALPFCQAPELYFTLLNRLNHPYSSCKLQLLFYEIVYLSRCTVRLECFIHLLVSILKNFRCSCSLVHHAYHTTIYNMQEIICLKSITRTQRADSTNKTQVIICLISINMSLSMYYLINHSLIYFLRI